MEPLDDSILKEFLSVTKKELKELNMKDKQSQQKCQDKEALPA